MNAILNHLPAWVIPTTAEAMRRRLLQMVWALLVGAILQLLLWIRL